MDLISIVSGLLPYVLYSIFFIILMMLGYFIFRKKYKISATKFILIILLVCWGVVVFGITTLSRPAAFFEGQVNLSLFSGYVNAWNQWSFSEFQLILLNVLMFVPLGILLPIIHHKNKSFWRMLVISITFTLCIEVFQFVTGKGIFELDDLLHNTIGSLAGYFFVMLFIQYREQRKWNLAATVKALSIPLFFVLLFIVASLVYNAQEFGNLPFKPAQKQSMEQIKIELETKLSSKTIDACVYYNKDVKDLKRLKSIAQNLSKQFNIEQQGNMRLEGENRKFNFVDEEGIYYSLDSRMVDGSWSFSSHTMDEERLKIDMEPQKQLIENWLSEEKLLPTNAMYQQQDDRTLRWELPEIDNLQSLCENFSEGFMITTLSNLEIPESIIYEITDNKFVAKKQIISEQQAFEALLNGEFSIYNDLKKGDTLTVTDILLSYSYDTKGYYQPVYNFTASVNDPDFTVNIEVPAIQ